MEIALAFVSHLRDLGVYDLPTRDVIKRMSFEYVVDVNDLKESDYLIPKLKFNISQNVKYIYQEPEGMCGISYFWIPNREVDNRHTIPSPHQRLSSIIIGRGI